jgi:type IV pilus assembly protein PilV
MIRDSSWRRSQIGVTLVEVLVTLVSCSVGLLGIAALQLVSLRGSHEASVRLQASTLASAMLDRMRANRPAFLEGEYSETQWNQAGDPDTRSGRDLRWWQAEIDRLLPGDKSMTAGMITCEPRSSEVTVSIRWGNDQPASTVSFTLDLRSEI